MARERRQRRANLSDLIAAKDYAQAIEVLREQLSQRPPGTQRRLQLADLLLLAGRRGEALPILESIADELMKDGFAAKAVAILKRIDRLDPGRPDVEARLTQLAAHRPGGRPVPVAPAAPAADAADAIAPSEPEAPKPAEPLEAWADDGEAKPVEATSASVNTSTEVSLDISLDKQVDALVERFVEKAAAKPTGKSVAESTDTPDEKSDEKSDEKVAAPAAEPAAPSAESPHDGEAKEGPRPDERKGDEPKAEESKTEQPKAAATPGPEEGRFTGMLKRLFTMLPRKSDDTASSVATDAAVAEKPGASADTTANETTPPESLASENADPDSPAVDGPAADSSAVDNPTPTSPATESPAGEAQASGSAAEVSPKTEGVAAESAPATAPPREAIAETTSESSVERLEAPTPEPPPPAPAPAPEAPAAETPKVDDEEPAANVLLDKGAAEPATEATASPAEEMPAPPSMKPAEPEASPNVVEKLGGVFKKFLAALPGANEEDELDSEVVAREFVAALAASGLDQDDDDDEGELIAAFIDEDPMPPASDDDAPATASAPPNGETEPTPTPSPTAPAPALPRVASGTPISESDFRDQVLDLLEQVLKQPADAVESLVATTENTEPLAAAYRDTLLVHPLFSDLSPSEMLAVLRALRLVFMEPGDIIVTEGEPGASLFLIISGDVRLFVRNPAGHNVEVARLTEGAFFGEMSLLSGKPRNATVIAGSRVEMLELPKAMLDGIAQAHPHVRDIVDALYLQRASSPEVAAVRSVPIGTENARERAREVLRSYFGGRPFEPRMQLKLATVLLKSGKHEEAVPVLVAIANELLREGDTPKAIAILKKVEAIRKRSLEVVNLAPLSRENEEAPAPEPETPPANAGTEADGGEASAEAPTETFFAQWLSDTVRRANAESKTPPPRRIPGYAPDLLATPLFEGFSEEELLAFIQGLRLLAFEPGEVILTEGESGESVLILAAGSVKVSVRDPHGRSVVLCELHEGAFFGEISALSGRPRSATVTAAWNCELLELDRTALDGIATTHPRIRQVLEEAYIERAGSAEAARIRTAGRVQPEA